MKKKKEGRKEGRKENDTISWLSTLPYG